MATYLKRTSKLFDLSISGRSVEEVNIRDFMCPICRGILIEPVTLPCTHNLCLKCLKGTFEHNSLSCPLCRVRVGSWLRTATKSSTLINNDLWDYIRANFQKEVQGKQNGQDIDIDLDSGFNTTNRIISARGEIRREYEAELQMIRKIQEQAQQQRLTQMAQDEILAKTLAREQIISKEKEHMGKTGESSNDEAAGKSKYLSVSKKQEYPKVMDNVTFEKKSNVALISKIRAERYASDVSALKKNSISKLCCQKMEQPSSFPSTYSMEPGCSVSNIYGTQSKEELRVPSDVLCNEKKSLGVKVCMNISHGESNDNVNNKRIGSAESAGSHDSINQEIHHFKPIKAMPRTPLKMSPDGKQIDPKLIRVIPVLKKCHHNVLPKAPSPIQLKRMFGCSWSAFKGKARQNLNIKENLIAERKIFDMKATPSSSTSSSSSNNQSYDLPTKSHRNEKVSESSNRLNFVPESSFDSNKNYTKGINSKVTINGTKMNKKLHTVMKSNSVNKRTRRKLKQKQSTEQSIDCDNSSVPLSSASNDIVTGVVDFSNDHDVAVENIAERIKKRNKYATKKEVASESNRRSKRRGRNVTNTDNFEVSSTKKSKPLRVTRNSSKSDATSCDITPVNEVNDEDEDEDEVEGGNEEKIEEDQDEDDDDDDDDEVAIKEQERIARMLQQEKKDFELAQRLQAKFDEMESIAGRTRRSRKTLNLETVSVDLLDIEHNRTRSKRRINDTSAKRLKHRKSQRKRAL